MPHSKSAFVSSLPLFLVNPYYIPLRRGIHRQMEYTSKRQSLTNGSNCHYHLDRPDRSIPPSEFLKSRNGRKRTQDSRSSWCGEQTWLEEGKMISAMTITAGRDL